ncbi:reverse transcriptase domain-containing protein [Tanacetum coccineum]
MDSMISIRQKNTLAEYMILSGADNRPPMLDKDLYDYWKSRMELYMQNRQYERMILESVENSPLIWPTIEENGATNIILQGLPIDIYSLVNHHRVTKDLWEIVQLLMQVNIKFLTSLPPKWSKFVTDVKLVKDLHTANYDQLHAYLEQHELYANEVRIMRERSRSTCISQQRVVKCFNYKGEGHMARQCPKPKRKRDATWFRDKVLLVEAHGKGKVLNEEELEFLVDPGVAEGPDTQSFITHNAAYQANDLDAYDYDCGEISTAKAVLIANFSSYGSNFLSEVPYSNNTHNDMLNQSVQEMPYSEQTNILNYPKNEITSDSNIIPYSQYLLETQNAAVQDTNSSTQQDDMILSVFEQLSNQVSNCNKVNKDNLILPMNSYLLSLKDTKNR